MATREGKKWEPGVSTMQVFSALAEKEVNLTNLRVMGIPVCRSTVITNAGTLIGPLRFLLISLTCPSGSVGVNVPGFFLPTKLVPDRRRSGAGFSTSLLAGAVANCNGRAAPNFCMFVLRAAIFLNGVFGAVVPFALVIARAATFVVVILVASLLPMEVRLPEPTILPGLVSVRAATFLGGVFVAVAPCALVILRAATVVVVILIVSLLPTEARLAEPTILPGLVGVCASFLEAANPCVGASVVDLAPEIPGSGAVEFRKSSLFVEINSERV